MSLTYPGSVPITASRYDGMMIHLQGNVTRRFNLVANYTLSKAKTWGCVLGELFDYVDGVCDPLHAFGEGDFGPSGRTSRIALCSPGSSTFLAVLKYRHSPRWKALVPSHSPPQWT